MSLFTRDDFVWLPPLIYMLVMELIPTFWRRAPWQQMSLWVFHVQDRWGPVAGRGLAWAILIFLLLLAVHLAYHAPLFGPRSPV